MGISITASAYCVPENRLTHADLAARFGDVAMHRIEETTGIHERRVAPAGVCASDLALRAAQQIFKEYPVNPAEIDALIFASQTPDYLLPATACTLQHRLSLPMHIAAFDINLACSQYVYAHSVAYAMIKAGTARRVLVLTGDTVSRILHPMDRSVVPLFGDAGTAALVEQRDDKAGFVGFDFGTDGSGAEALIWPTSGLREPRTALTAIEETDTSGNIRRRDDLHMDGAMTMVFTLKRVAGSINNLLDRQGYTLQDIDLFIFHQASTVILDSIQHKLGLPAEKVPRTCADFGNSGGSSVGVTLTECLRRGQIKPGMRIVLSAFGGGLSWASALLIWPDYPVIGTVADGTFPA